MYQCEKTPWGKLLTESEILNETVSARKLRMILQMKKVSVKDMRRDTNSYGEFLFISAQIGKTGMEFYGCGFHDLRNRWMTEEFKMFMNQAPKVPGWKKEEVLEYFDKEYDRARNLSDCDSAGNKPTELDEMADLCGDDDAFMAELEDNPQLAEQIGAEI